MKTFIYLLLSFFIIHANAQVTFTNVPQRLQVVPRNVITNIGYLKISGSAAASSHFKEIIVKKYRENEFQQIYKQQLSYDGDSAKFNFAVPLKAEMANYEVLIFGKNNNNSVHLLAAADSLLAGDAFIIQGQSNAVASRASKAGNPENQNSFIRVWGSTGSTDNADSIKYKHKWFIADGDIRAYRDGNCGQWGLRLAKLLLDQHKIPIVIFNGANSGYPIILLERNDENPYDLTTTYGRCLQRVTETAFQNDIHAIFWYQGESDSDNPYVHDVLNYYKNQFIKLHRDWKTDYKGFKQTYIIQIKQGCGGSEEGVNKIQEAQRQLAKEIRNTTILATNGQPHQNDQCHYAYDSGYRMTGNNLYPLVERDIYQKPNYPNIESPEVKRIVQTGATQITLYFKIATDTYIWEDGTERDFVLDEDTTAKFIRGVAKGGAIVLTLNRKLKGITTVSFQGHRIGGSPCIRNMNGLGMVGFYKISYN